METYILLSSNGLQNSSKLNLEQDFNFNVGTHQYKCSKVLASFISPKVSKLLLADFTITDFFIDHPDKNKEFNQIMSLMAGSALQVTNENKIYLFSIAVQLGNEEMINFLMGNNNVITNDNVIQRIIFRYSNNFQYLDEVKYLARHFEEFSIENLRNLDVDVLNAVLNQDSLLIFNEDSLFEKIISLGEQYYSLLDNIQIMYLTCNSISKFLSYLDFENISFHIWLSIINRLQLFVFPQPNPIRHSNTFILDDQYPFNGIFAFMMAKYDGNIDDKGIVNITASSDPGNNMKFVSDSDWNSYWFSDNVPDSWIQFDFKEKSIIVTDYTLQSDGSDGNYLLHWQLEGSNDGAAWEVIDKRDTNDLNSFYKIKSYSCFLKKPFKKIRLKQTGKNSSNQDYFHLASIEFFGELLNCNSILK